MDAAGTTEGTIPAAPMPPATPADLPEPPALPSVAPGNPVATLSTLPVEAPPVALGSARGQRWIELGLLLAVAFGQSLYVSVAAVTGSPMRHSAASLRWVFSSLHELTALALCAYFLRQQGRSFRTLGLRWRWHDLFLAPGIMCLALLAAYAVGYGFYLSGHYADAERASHARVIQDLLGPGVVWSMVVFTVINGFFEELIVRAYLLTDVTLLTGSTALAVVASAGFQGAYHLYQGWQAALSVTAAFLVFSLFYVGLRRIAPVVLAHILWDLLLLVGYNHWHAGHPR